MSIAAILIYGNTFFKTGDIKKLFGYNRTILWFGKFPRYSPLLIKRGITVLESMYRDSGFFDVRIHWNDSI